MDLVERISTLTSYGARWVMWLLIALSVLALAIIIERAVLFFSSRDDITRLRTEIRRLLGSGQKRAALRKLEESPSFEARVAAAGLECELAEPAEERMQGEQELVRLHMEKRLIVLGTLGSNAPFVGLLGTVIGIVRAFRELESAKAQVSSGLMTEVGEALVATAIGLLVALPAVAAFNAFQRLVRQRLGQAEVLKHEVLSHLKGASVLEAAE